MDGIPGPVSYGVYITRWGDDQIIGQVPAREIEWEGVVSDDGLATFTLDVPRGGASWRAYLSPVMSGVLIAEGDQIRWGGWVIGEQQSGDRAFRFTAVEWGRFLASVYVSPLHATIPPMVGVDDSEIIRRLAVSAVSRAGQGIPLEVQATTAGATSDLIEDVRPSSLKDFRSLIQAISDQADGPEWACRVEGTLSQPRRILRVASLLGRQAVAESRLCLEWIADYGGPVEAPGAPPLRTSLDNLYPSWGGIYTSSARTTRRHGGNVVATPQRTRVGMSAATEVHTTGAGMDDDKLMGHASDERMIQLGWPRIEASESHPDVTVQATLDRHAVGALGARRGLTTAMELTTFAEDPDLASYQLGDVARIVMETDLYGYARPGEALPVIDVERRTLGYSVRVDDNGGPTLVTYRLRDAVEVN